MKRIVLLMCMTLLSACHHQNPLQKEDKAKSATFLMNASANAEKRLNLPVKEGDRGLGYFDCMEGRKFPEINCQSLYQAMVSFAQEGHYPAFHSLTVSDLTNKPVFEQLAEDYLEITADVWPTYY